MGKTMNTIQTWHSHDPLTIRIIGSGAWVKEKVEKLETDFNEPKFGYNNELWDEHND